MQRFGAGCWSGDINNTWATLEAQPSLGLNMGLSGVPLWGTDIGGFYPVAPQTAELFVRWFQFGAFNPVFRCHGRNWRMHLPFAYGADVEAVCRRYLELRYRLMPYTYTLAWQAHSKGLPLMRPLALNYPDDPEALDRSSEYLWGDDILVAPVTRDGARHWPVYLPEGAWYDFWTGEAFLGGRSVMVEAPLDRLPLFVRGGAIIPMGPAVQHLTGYSPDEITLLIYPEGSSSFTLYEDDGETNRYREGEYLLTEITCRASDTETLVGIASVNGDSAVAPAGPDLHAQNPRGEVAASCNGEWESRGVAAGRQFRPRHGRRASFGDQHQVVKTMAKSAAAAKERGFARGAGRSSRPSTTSTCACCRAASLRRWSRRARSTVRSPTTTFSRASAARPACRRPART